MASDNKDRLGDHLHNVEKAREDQWARKRDAELIEKMRERLSQAACPNCKEFLVPKTKAGVSMFACPDGCGAWIDEPALKSVLKAKK